MTHIARATLADIPAIRAMAEVVFPATYGDILSQEQIAYMMEWMYSPENLHKQMVEEGHIYYIAYQEGEPAGYLSIQQEGKDVFHLQKIYVSNGFLFLNILTDNNGKNCSLGINAVNINLTSH